MGLLPDLIPITPPGHRRSGIVHHFRLAVYPVTKADYHRLFPEMEDAPDQIMRITWESALQYCNVLNETNGLPPAYDLESGKMLTGSGEPTTSPAQVKGFRLPTASEWCAAIFGYYLCTKLSPHDLLEARLFYNNTYPMFSTDTDDLLKRGLGFCEHSLTGHKLISELRPNELGVFGLLGQAREWCGDLRNASCRRDESYRNYHVRTSGIRVEISEGNTAVFGFRIALSGVA